jgi:hypothetical protein
MLGNVRSVGLCGAALMMDSDRTTHLLRICAGQGSTKAAVVDRQDAADNHADPR